MPTGIQMNPATGSVPDSTLGGLSRPNEARENLAFAHKTQPSSRGHGEEIASRQEAETLRARREAERLREHKHD